MSLAFPFPYMLCNSDFISISLLANPSNLRVIQPLSISVGSQVYRKKISVYTCLLLQSRVVGTFINTHRLSHASILRETQKKTASLQYLAVKKSEAMSLTSIIQYCSLDTRGSPFCWIATCSSASECTYAPKLLPLEKTGC